MQKNTQTVGQQNDCSFVWLKAETTPNFMYRMSFLTFVHLGSNYLLSAAFVWLSGWAEALQKSIKVFSYSKSDTLF